MIDVQTPFSPGWWMDRLAKKLVGRQKRLKELHDRFAGDPPLPVGAENMRDAYRAFQRKARANYAELIVEATRERMLVAGFRTAAEHDENGDAKAREIWDANSGAVLATDVHESMLALGDAYVIVGGPSDDLGGAPVITAEDPRQVVTIHDPVQQRKVRAGLKLFHDDELGRDYAYLYLPGSRYVASRETKRTARSSGGLRFSPSWDWDESLGGADGEGFPFDVVPVVRFRNRRGVGEFEPHIDLLDRINHQILQRMVIATMQAFRQRAVKGDLPDTDETGQPIDYEKVFTADPGGLWQLPAGVELWESGQVELTGVLAAIKDDVRELSAVTRVPLPTMLPGDGTDSAEGATFKREGLVFKVEDRITRATEGWKDVMSYAFLFANETERSQRGAIDVLWVPPERRSLSERAQASSQAQDVPWHTRMSAIWGFRPEEIARMETERAADALLAPAPVVAPALTA